ncbi:hypothetical protein OkiPb01554_08590 [Bordetella pertussis]
MRQRRIQPGGGDGLFEDLRRIGAVGQQGHHAIAFPGLDLRLGARLAEQRPLGLGAEVGVLHRDGQHAGLQQRIGQRVGLRLAAI